ncbi:4-coumarate--CoA ligase 1-like isoform X2 [Agrilus planipennis]|nr:4-coumarate--CoA ligase 1-like isoform X2 [Agrilus planipennis]
MDHRGLGHILFEKLAEHGKDVMQIDTITGEKDTFESFRLRCIRTALHMKSNGLGPQDIITICTCNTLNAPVPLIASILIGVIPNTLDPSFSADEFKHYLQIIKPKVMFVASEIEPLIKEAIKANNLNTEIIIFGSSFNDFLKPSEEEETFVPFLPLSIRDTVLILFSSGTTGTPKAVCLSHISFCLFVSPTGIKSNRNHFLPFSSLHWISHVGATFSNIVHGSVKLVCPTFDNPRTFCDIARDYNLRTTSLTPYRLMEISKYCINNGVTLSLDNIIVGGAPLTKEHIRLTTKAFPTAKITNVYGQTELVNISFFPRNEKLAKKHEEKVFKGSCGKIGPGITMRIVDLDTEDILGPNEEGEIRIRSHTLMNGYYGVDSSDVYDSQGWFKTGDIGYYDEDEFLYIVGRCKEILRYKSFPINPSILEDILLHHPAIKECIVIGVPHEIDGDHPVAFVTLKEGYNIDPNELQNFVDGRVDDRNKLRGGVILIDKIPLTPTGKPQRRVLKEMLQTLKA